MKKLLAIVLSLVLIVTLAPMTGGKAKAADPPRTKVTLDLRGGHFDLPNRPNPAEVELGGNLGHWHLITAVKEGYVLTGWAVDPANKTEPDIPLDEPLAALDHFYPACDMTLYAIWVKSDGGGGSSSPEQFATITFDANGGVNNNYTTSGQYLVGSSPFDEEAFDLMEQCFSKPGHYFAGWSTDKNASEPNFGLGSVLLKDTTLYAVYKPGSRIKFYYGADWCYGGPDEIIVEPGQALPAEIFTTNIPRAADWAFAGWKDSEDSEVQEVNITRDFIPTKSMTLYPVWQKTYSLNFMTNDGSGESRSYAYYEGETADKLLKEMTDNPPQRTGYIFKGWALNPDASQPNIPQGYKLPNVKENFYAVWKKANTVTLHMGSDSYIGYERWDLPFTVGSGQPLSFLNEIPLAYKENSNVALLGWSDSKSGTTVNVTAESIANKDMDLYPVWGRGHAITVQARNGDDPYINSGRNPFYIPHASLLGPSMARAEYAVSYTDHRLLGWADNADAVEPNLDDLMPVTDSMTIYPIWQKTVDVVFDNLDPNGNGGNEIHYCVDEGQTLPQQAQNLTLEARGYDFLGWSENPDSTSADADLTKAQYPSPFAAQKFYYPVWAPKHVSISFDAGKGSGAPANISVPYMTEVGDKMPTEKPSRKGYKFKGWVLDPRHKQPSFTKTYKPATDLTVHALWEEDISSPEDDIDRTPILSLVFNANGGKNAPAPVTARQGKPAPKFPTVEPTRKGYIFKGWSTSPNATKRNYTRTTRVPRSRVLYAVWQKDPKAKVKVTFNNNGGKNGPGTLTTEKGKALGSAMLQKKPTRYAYNFLGWSTTKDGSSSNFNSGTRVNKDMTVYARWAKAKSLWHMGVYDITVRDKFKLQIPRGVNKNNLTWSCTNTSVAEVKDGVVSAKTPGAIWIRAKLDYRSYYYIIRVAPRPPEWFKVRAASNGNPYVSLKLSYDSAGAMIYRSVDNGEFERYNILRKSGSRPYVGKVYRAQEGKTYKFYAQCFKVMPTYKRDQYGYFKKSGSQVFYGRESYTREFVK